MINMDTLLQEHILAIKDSYKHMIVQLHEWCGINSGTENLHGQQQMRNIITQAFSPIADEIITYQLPPITQINMAGDTIMQTYGDALYIRKRPCLKKRVLLSGHMDTVYTENDAFQHLTYMTENILRGPGVADMKGGLIIMLQALRNFEQLPCAKQLGWDVFINADEEIGSLASQHLFTEVAPLCQTALVYEPAMPGGFLAKNRKGSGKFTLIAEGKAAHVGRAFHDGRNAICYLAEAISAIHALNYQQDNVHINVGKIAGGSALNIVPDKAVAKLDVRITNADDATWVHNKIDNIINKMQCDGYKLTLHGNFHRPVKKINQAHEHLFTRVQNIAKSLGITLKWKDSGGCCDGNNLAMLGLPTLDTLGVCGGDIHTPNEFVLLDSLVERTALSTLLLEELAS